MSRRRAARTAVLLLAWLLPVAPAAAAPASEPPPLRLVLLYLPCTVNRSFLSPYAPEIPYTPNLGRLARDAVVFLRHTSEAGHSGPAYASILSGTQAPEHQVFAQPTRIPDAVELVTERFAAAGWDTWFWGGHVMASARYGYAQGVPAANRFDRGLLQASRPFPEILERIERDPDYRALVVTHFTVTHAPYSEEHLGTFCARYGERCARARSGVEQPRRLLDLYASHYKNLQLDLPNAAIHFGLRRPDVQALARLLELLYAANVHRLDDGFGRVLAQIEGRGLAPRSLVVFAADHGERLFREKGLFHWTHGWELAPEVLTAPLLIWAPGRLAPARYPGVTRSTDVFPTVAGLAGIPAAAASPEPLRGVDLSPALRGRAPAPELDAFSHTMARHGASSRGLRHWYRYHSVSFPGTTWVSLRRGDAFYKFRDQGGGRFGFEAFDLAADPFAEEDRFDPQDPRHARAAGELRSYRRRLYDAWHARRASPARDAAAREALRSLGYAE